MKQSHTGGCQCGAVRFVVEGPLGRASICHCRMCQKAFGAFYGPFVSAPKVRWTTGAPKYFASSNRVRRGFCEACGTPLSFEPDDGQLGPPKRFRGRLAITLVRLGDEAAIYMNPLGLLISDLTWSEKVH